MSTQLKWIKTSQIQSLLLMGLLVFFVAHFMLLSPSGLEEDFNGVRIIHPKDFLAFIQKEPTSIPDVPAGVAPDYTLREFKAFSSTESKPNWKLSARKSSAYNEKQLLHGRDIRIDLPDGTVVIANEGVFFMQKNEGKFYGSVVATFNNGVVIKTNYAEVKSSGHTTITIPTSEMVQGTRTDVKNPVSFTSMGLTYSDSEPQVLYLLSQVAVELNGEKKTQVYSDLATYQSAINRLDFAMNEARPIEQQLIKVKQNDLDLFARELEVELDPKKQLQTITAIKEVSIRDFHDPKNISTATSGKAIYYEHKNEFVLKDFPQIYQNGDTVTGDVIIYNRNTDIIEVKESNAIYKH